MEKLPPVQYDLITLAGGLDQITPTLSLPSGFARRAANFECSLNGGYTRIAGYDRYDGRASPADARYNVLTCTLTGSVAVGNTITGLSSAATGKVIAISGADLIITRETGTFSVSEYISVSAVNVGQITAIVGTVADGLTDATYKLRAANDYRASIASVPGSGPIRGVRWYKNDVYAWRNNAGGTALAIYKSTSSGWTAVSLGKELAFSAGSAEILESNTVTGATSGATGVVARVVVQSGTWATSDAAGRLILSSTTGTFQAAENLQVAAATKAVAGGAATQITLSPNGRVESVVANFGGGTNNKRIYGIDGINRAFEFDGTTYVPLSTSMNPDVPTKIAAHKQHLFLAFGASLQFSSIGDPYSWDPVLGAGEIAMNDLITELILLPGDQSSGALAVYTKSDTSVLYGSSEANFALSTFNVGTGSMPYTAQNLDQTYVLNERGIMALGTTLNFGNFATATLTMNLRPFIQANRTLASASIVNREKGQYRVFFSDGNALYLTMASGKYMGAMPVQYPDPVLCATEGEKADGTETAFFGSDNGFVYQMDTGASFDGEDIAANISLVYNSVRSPRLRKRFRKASVELTGDSYSLFQFGVDYGYRSQEIDQPADSTHANDLRAAFWDTFEWDNFVFDGNDLIPSEVELAGTAENLAIRISSVSNLIQPFTVNSIILHYTPRRGLR
jgi:hypothetical protein